MAGRRRTGALAAGINVLSGAVEADINRKLQAQRDYQQFQQRLQEVVVKQALASGNLKVEVGPSGTLQIVRGAPVQTPAIPQPGAGRDQYTTTSQRFDRFGRPTGTTVTNRPVIPPRLNPQTLVGQLPLKEPMDEPDALSAEIQTRTALPLAPDVVGTLGHSPRQLLGRMTQAVMREPGVVNRGSFRRLVNVGGLEATVPSLTLLGQAMTPSTAPAIPAARQGLPPAGPEETTTGMETELQELLEAIQSGEISTRAEAESILQDAGLDPDDPAFASLLNTLP